MQLNRRDFLKLSGAALAGGAALPQTTSRAFASQAGDLGILYDASKCVGCRACQNACRDWNGTPAEPDPTGLYDAPMELSADTWTLIKLNKRSETDWHFMSYQCMHCTDAACVTVCPTGALFKDERGFTAYDREKCNGCGYCTQFCPFGVPHLKTTSLLTGEAKTAKCTFCQDRIWGDLGGPSCAEACPVEALIWGRWEELLDKAKERVAVLQDQGLSGVRLYGENETGGLHRLSILLDEPSAYGLPIDPQGPITFSNVWQKIIQPLGEVALGATILGVIGAFFITRRNIRMEEVE
jgi:formate dehydrogenase iron-sulfur subunit